MSEQFSYNPGSGPRDDVRLLIQDTDAIEAIFTDAELDRFLYLKSDNVLRASAIALRTMATNQIIVLKVTRVLGFNTDGAAVGRALKDQAALLDTEADLLEQQEGTSYDFAEIVTTTFAAKERLWKELLRNQTAGDIAIEPEFFEAEFV